VTTNWRSAPDHRTLPTVDWVTDACERALRRAEEFDGETEILTVLSPVQVKLESARPWATQASMMLSDLTLVLSHKIGFFRGATASLVFPLKEITRCELSESSDQRLELGHPQESVKLTFSTARECTAVLDWYWGDSR
jgi:hypothetical protein